MKRLLFDLSPTQPIGSSKFHGGGKYGIIVFKKFYELFPNNVAVYYDDKKYIDKEISAQINNKIYPAYLKHEISLFDAARKESSVVYCCLYDISRQSEPPHDIHLIYTEHGLRVLELWSDEFQKYYTDQKMNMLHKMWTVVKEALYGNGWKKSILSARDLFRIPNLSIITVSQHSKSAFMAFCPQCDENKLHVFYSPSTSAEKPNIQYLPNKYNKYWLLVSGNRWVKNSARAILAFDELFTERPQLEGQVVITGLKSWYELCLEIKNPDRFILVGYVDEIELKSLYHNAYLLVYPSLNEGFGYPPLEAMHEGCPVIASAVSSIPEVCGDGVMYFNPFLIPEIKMRILMMEDRTLRDEYRLKGIEREMYIHAKQDSDLKEMCEFLYSYIRK